MEVEVPIEFGRTFIDGIDNDSPSPELASPSHTTSESVDEQVTAEVVSLFDPFDGKASEQHNSNRVGHSPPKPRGRSIMIHSTHGKRVVTDNAPFPADHIGCTGARSLGAPGAVIEPTVEAGLAGVELTDQVILGQQLDRTERLGGHLVGIGLGSLA